MGNIISRSALLERLKELLADAEKEYNKAKEDKMLRSGIHIGIKWCIKMLLEAPAVDAVVLPFLPGDDLWYVDDEDDYKVKPYDDKVLAVAYFGGNRFRVVHKGGMFIPGEGNLCTSKEEAEALRDELLSNNAKDVHKCP